MKNFKLKGFSLIECIVAMALIGIASLLIAQVYGSVAFMNRNNAHLNTSLIEQMKMAERGLTYTNDAKLGGEAVAIDSNTKHQVIKLYSYHPHYLDGMGNLQEIPGADISAGRALALVDDGSGVAAATAVKVGSTYTTIGGVSATANCFRIRPGCQDPSNTSNTWAKADVEYVILKPEATVTDATAGTKFTMDTSVRYKFILPKTTAEEDDIANYH